jgi:hypothetical protein
MKIEGIVKAALQHNAAMAEEAAALEEAQEIVAWLEEERAIAPSTWKTLTAAVAQIEEEIVSVCVVGKFANWNKTHSLGFQMLLVAFMAFRLEVEAREQGFEFEVDQHGRYWLHYEDGVHDVGALCIPYEGESAHACVSRIGAALRMGCPHCAAAQATGSTH